MKLKYYLRGLGIGVLVTAIVMSVSNKNAVTAAREDAIKNYHQQTETEIQQDETQEIIETQVYSEILEKNDKTLNETGSDEQPVVETEFSSENMAGDAEIEMPQVNETGEHVIEIGNEEVEIVIEVLPGATATSVATSLLGEGIITDKDEFILFMQQNGYDKKIRTGTKIIKMSDSWEMIGQKLITKEQ